MSQSAPHDANRNAAIGGKSTLTGEFLTPYVDPATGRLLVDTDSNSQFISLIDYVGGTNPIYLGNAVPGTASSSPQWQIRKIAYDTNNNATSVLFAAGTASFSSTWDNRASLTYS